MTPKNTVGHTLLMGPVGSGKTIYARKQTGFCGEPDKTMRARNYCYRVANLNQTTKAPWRAPHHTISRVGMEGRVNGHMWQPGELSLAHGGTLFLDDLAQFNTNVLESVFLSVTQQHIEYRGEGHYLRVPTCFRLIGSLHSCPCGSARLCSCTRDQIDQYRARVPAWVFDLCTIVHFPQPTHSSGEKTT